VNTCYESARAALARVMEACEIPNATRVEDLLPADPRYEVCEAEHLVAALHLAGIDATIYAPVLMDELVIDALGHGYLVLLQAGCHSEPRSRRWVIALNTDGMTFTACGGGYEDPLPANAPIHWCPATIIVRGRTDEKLSHYPEEDL